MNQFEIGSAEEDTFHPIDAGHVGTGAMDNAAYPPAQQPTQKSQQSQMNMMGSGTMQSVNNGIGGAGGDQSHQDQPTGFFGRLTSCFRIGSLQSYFDVDTVDVQERVVGSVLHANAPDYFVQDLLNKQGKSADLYGPVWITMTCVFLFAVTSNTAKYLHTDSLTDFEYDISHLTHAFYVFSFYTFILPFIIFLIFKAINVPLTLSELISLYGYSLVPYLPTTILCLIPSVLLEWFFLLCATGLSCLLILRNVAGPVVRSNRGWSGPVMLTLMGCHFVFFLVLKWTFYKHRFHGTSNKGENDDNFAGDGGDNNIDDGIDEGGDRADRW